MKQAVNLPKPPTPHSPFRIIAGAAPVIVNGKWEIPFGESAEFQTRKFLWWHWWKLVRVFSNTPRQ